MSEQTLMPIIGANNQENKMKAQEALELARSAHERYLLGRMNSDLEEAIEYYVDAVKYDPNIPEAYYRLATLMWEQGQISLNGAIEQCQTALSLSPQSTDAHLYAGYFLQMSENYDSAVEEYKSAIKEGKLNSARPRLIMSQAILQKILEKNGGLKDYTTFLYYLLTGGVMLAWDKPALKMICANLSKNISVFSYNTLGKIFERFKMVENAEKVYRHAAVSTLNSELFYNKIGDLALSDNNYEMSLDCYRKVLEANPQNKEVLIKLASVIQTYFPENTDEAIDCYERLLQFDTNKASIYYELGHLYLAKDDRINSISAFKLAVDLDSENPFFNNSLAYAYARAELFDDAIEHYQKAISLNPDSEWTSIVCLALGTIYSQHKLNSEAAISTYHAGIILDPKNYELYLAMGDLYMSDYDVDKAIKTYCDAIAVSPDDYRAYSKIGVALWEKEYLEEALVAYHKAVELNPENEYSQNNLGILYLDGLADAEEALEYFEQAIEINPNYTLAYFNAGRASQQLGFTNDAARYYQTAIDLNQISEELDDEDIQSRLHSLFEV